MAEALAAIEHTPFDAVVLDIMLPGLDGLEVTRQTGGRVPPPPPFPVPAAFSSFMA